MDKESCIMDLNDQPFTDFARAAKMRDLLNNEAQTVDPGSFWHYQVMQFVDGDDTTSYIVERHGAAVTRNQVTEGDDASVSMLHPVPIKIYRQALRTHLLYLPILLATLCTVLFTVDIWLAILSFFQLDRLPRWIDGDLLIQGTRIAGGLCFVWVFMGRLIEYYGSALIVDGRGVTLKRGIITQDVTQVRFSDIRTIGLHQGILDRLLNIGLLEFASSGTDDMDIRFFNMVDPAGVKARIEALIQGGR